MIDTPHDPEQAWFWSDEWQAKEREADEDLARGDYEVFDHFEDFVNSLPPALPHK